MRRTILLLLAGAGFGAVAVYSLVPRGQPTLASIERAVAAADTANTFAARIGRAAEHADAAPPTEQRLALYRVAAEADASTLRSLIEEAAALAPSAWRFFTLEALLTRYAEIDPAAAVRQAHELEIESGLLEALYRTWARADAEEALRALRDLDEVRTTRALALSLVEVLGDAEPVVARLLEALPQIEPRAFRADVVARQAATTPEAALRQALAMSDPRAMRRAVRGVGEAWAQADPLGAAAQIQTIEDPTLRAAFEEIVLREWAQAEPEAVLEYLAETGIESRPEAMIGSSVMADIASADPVRVLELAERLPQPLDQWATQIGLQALAEDDPMRALAYVEGTPAGPMRQSYMHIIASAYGRRDAEAALEWARSQEARTQGLVGAAIGGIARVDIDKALDLAMAETQPTKRLDATRSIVISLAAGHSGQFEEVADRMLAENDLGAAQQAFYMLTSMWASTDPEATLGWLLANSESVGAEGFRQAAQQLGHQHAALAARYTSQVPDEARPVWIMRVAEGYARSAPDEAVSWISQFRGEAGYDEGVAAIVQNMAHSDPLGAARLLDGIDASGQMATMAAATVAGAWAAQDPPAAADWARGLNGEETRRVALRGIAEQWAAQDSYSARSWVLTLPRGDERDGALASLVGAADRDDLTDPVLMNAFSSDDARQRALLPAIFRTGQNDEAAARSMIDEYITDPRLRQQAEQMLGSNRNGGVSMISRGMSPAFFIP